MMDLIYTLVNKIENNIDKTMKPTFTAEEVKDLVHESFDQVMERHDERVLKI